MDHDAVAHVEAHMVGLTPAEPPVEDEVAGLESIEGDGLDHGPLGSGVVGQFDTHL